MGWMNMPLISVVLPVCNEAQSLGTSLPSLFRQVFRDIEVIAIDEGSNDGSLELLSRHERDGRLYLLHHLRSGGRLAACNDAARRASGAWLMFFDPRDLLLFDHLSRMAEAISRHPHVELFASAYEKMGQLEPVRVAMPMRGVLSRRVALANYARADFLQPHATCIRRKRFLTLGGFPEHYPQGGETHFWLRALCELEAIHYDDTVTSLWLAPNDDASANEQGLPLHPVVELLHDYAQRLPLRERHQFKGAVNRKLLEWAWHNRSSGLPVREELSRLNLASLPLRLWPRAARLLVPPAWLKQTRHPSK